MANEDHVARLKQGLAAWNAWRAKHESVVPDLSGAKLERANLRVANLYGAKEMALALGIAIGAEGIAKITEWLTPLGRSWPVH
jgi:hypothetical protein